MKKIINILIIICLVIGIILGIYCPNFINNISFIGTIYINLLKFMIIPILFTTIMITIYKTSNNKGKLLIKAVLLFIIMFIISFLITSLVVFIINPSKGFTFGVIKWTGEVTDINISNIIINLFPTNIIDIFKNNMVFPTIILAIACGLISTKVDKGSKVIDVVEGLRNIFNKLLEFIMYLTPIGVLSLIGTTIANHGNVFFGVGIKYIGTAYLCSIIIMIIVMILPVWIIAKINPITYIKKVSKIWLLTITTCSSAATLPNTLKICKKDLNISDDTADSVIPLGCTIHMCGGAVSFALLGIFCSNLYGIPITFTSFLLMLISATFINMAAPGIPNGGIVIGATYLSIFNIPLSFIGFYSGIYKLLDMSYTTLNVTGDISAALILNKYENKK